MAESRANRLDQNSGARGSASPGKLHVAIELAKAKWKLGFHDGLAASNVRVVTIAGGDLAGFEKEVRRAKQRFGLDESAPVFSCYEAGRDAFWVHRALEGLGVTNVVVDPASIAVDRRKRRAKTDRIDVLAMTPLLVRHCAGEKRVWRVARVPSREDEDARLVHRELETLKKEARTHADRISKRLATVGVEVAVNRTFEERLESVRLPDAPEQGVPRHLKSSVLREYRRWEQVKEQIGELDGERARQLKESKEPRVEKARELMRLRGVGKEGGWLLSMEFFGWRTFGNGGEVGGAAGLTPTPYNTGGSEREQGISKAGNHRVRAMMIELAWSWLRYQPASALSLWFNERYGKGGKRSRKVGIVALSRKLLVAFWRYLTEGVVPEGARMKAVASRGN